MTYASAPYAAASYSAQPANGVPVNVVVAFGEAGDDVLAFSSVVIPHPITVQIVVQDAGGVDDQVQPPDGRGDLGPQCL